MHSKSPEDNKVIKLASKKNIINRTALHKISLLLDRQVSMQEKLEENLCKLNTLMNVLRANEVFLSQDSIFQDYLAIIHELISKTALSNQKIIQHLLQEINTLNLQKQ